MNSEPHFSEAELADAFKSESVHLEPSEAHVKALRAQLLARTCDLRDPLRSATVALPTAQPLTRKPFSLLAKLATMAAVVMLAVMASRPFVGTAAGSLRSALDATRSNEWIHATTTVKRSGESIETESWCSPRQRIAAFRSPHRLHFVNYEEGIQSSYSDKTDSIYRWRADMNSENVGRAFLNALFTSGDLASSFPFHRVSAVDRASVEVGDQTRVQYSFQLELRVLPTVHWETVVQVDRSSGRIVSWEEQHAGGTQVSTRFDYPASGPSDIYKLGARSAAKIVDRVASSDVVELAKQFQQQVYNFDDYEALVIDRLQSADGSTTEPPLLRRICRAGKNFSIDLLAPAESDFDIPSEADLTWWRANRARFESTPLAMCDGESCTLYPAGDSQRESAAEMSPRVKSPTTIPVVTVKNSSGSTTIPIWPNLWPEYSCRPMLMTTDPSLRFDIDPVETDGQPNTLRLRMLAPDLPFSQERASYWLSLEHNRCIAKSILIQPNFENFTLSPVEKRVTTEYSHFQDSPSGITFASQNIISEFDSSKQTKRTFIVDFEVPQ